MKNKKSAQHGLLSGGSRFILRQRPETPVPFTPLDIVDHPQTADPLLAFGKKNGCRRAINTYGNCTPEKIHLIIWAHFKFPPDVAQALFVGQSRSDCTWNGKCVFTVNPFGQYTNLPKINTLFFNCTSISFCCENSLLRCVNLIGNYNSNVLTVISKSTVLWFTLLYENSCRNCSVTTSHWLLRREKNTIFLKCVVGSSQHTKAISRWKYAMLKSDYLFNFYWFRFNEMSNGEAETVRTLIWLWLKLWSVRCVAYIGPGLRD